MATAFGYYSTIVGAIVQDTLRPRGFARLL